jgi:cold shock CspA family protein
MLNNESGFLKSSARREKIFFHYSSIDLDESDDKLVLEEGQDMQFLVVEEEEGGGGSGEPERGMPRKRLSARRVQVKPRGSVIFHDVITRGVTGTVTLVPQCVDSSHLLEQHGKIRLDHPISATRYNEAGEPQPGELVEVREVFLATDDSPGGRFDFRGGSSVGLWTEIGDTLLFDVVQDYSDGACRAVPTRYVTPPAPDAPLGAENDGDVVPAVRLIELCPAGRAEGVIGALKDGYGFVQFAERSVDVHFKMFQILPDALQDDLRLNMGLPNVDDRGRRWELDVGVQVRFDISVQGTISTNASGGGNRSRNHQQEQAGNERENLKAQRILVLPPDTFSQHASLATGCKGVVKKVDAMQPYVGNIELDAEIQAMNEEARHPLTARMIRSYLERVTTEAEDLPPLVFHDVQSLKEDDVVIKLLETIGKGMLVHSYIPQPSYPGRLCIQKSAGLSGIESETPDCNDIDTNGETSEISSGVDDSKDPAKKKVEKVRPIKSLRYDKHSLIEELRTELPPGIGDMVEIDVRQCRRSCRVFIENMNIVERCQASGTATVVETAAIGVVKEFTPSKNFGFITLQEDSSTTEVLLFQMKLDADNGEGTTGKKGPKFRKGDVVKFDIASEENGKRTAVNVVSCPKSELKGRADKNVCLGIVLSQPSHTLSKHTPVRKTAQNLAQKNDKAGRWDTIDEDRKRSAVEDPITNPGSVLVTLDPMGFFTGRSLKTAEQEVNSDKIPDHTSEPTSKQYVFAKYKNGGLAVNGSGSSSIGDESTHPRRGDLVSFLTVKSPTKSGVSHFIREVRIVTREAATLVRGQLRNIVVDTTDSTTANVVRGSAMFVPDNDAQQSYDVTADDLVGFHLSEVKETEAVEGILHEGKVFGIARAADLYLESKHGSRSAERPKLNLTVKKDLGGRIMAQSMMAKGPDGTSGFAPGWTTRMSRSQTSVHASTGSSDLKVDAPEFTPSGVSDVA